MLDTQVKDATEKVDALTAEINDLTTQIETVQSAFDDASKNSTNFMIRLKPPITPTA